MAHVKRVMVAIAFMLVVMSPVWSAQTTTAAQAGLSYLHVAHGDEVEFFQFDERGVFLPQTEVPVALKEGYIVLSGQEPVTIRSPFATIVLQRESILTVGTTVARNPSFYLVAGSASFLVTPPFSGTFEVSTPVGIYRLSGPGEMFVSSDYAELIFSLGGEVRVMNAITRQITNLPPFTYLNLADPFLNTKQISRETFETLSINPDSAHARALPSANIADGLTFKAPQPLFPVMKASDPVTPPTVQPVATPQPSVAVEAPREPITDSSEQKLVAKDLPAEKVQSTEGLNLTISIPAPMAPVSVEPAVATPAPAEPVATAVVAEPIALEADPTRSFDVYVVHTNDILGELDGNGIGFARLATLLGWGRTLSDRNLVLDAGNTTSGTPVVEAFLGEPIAVLLDMLGYDAIAPGAADYAYGLARLREAAAAATQLSDIKLLAANIVDIEGNHLFEPYGLFDLDGYVVGVIGVSIPPSSIDGIAYLNDEIIAGAQALVDEVERSSDFVILLGNIGTDTPIDSTTIAREIHGLDLIIDGAQASIPSGGQLVNGTMIVSAGKQLSSVGVVQLQIENDVVKEMHALQITADDVKHPRNSLLAQAYGVEVVPEDPQVASYIESQQSRYLALQKPEETLIPEPPASVDVTDVQEVVVSTEAAPVATASAEDPLAIKQPLGIIGSPSEAPAGTTDRGVSTTFNISREGLRSGYAPKVGLSVNPFYNHNDFAIGLQAFFLTDGSLFDPSSYSIATLRQGAGTVNMVSSAIRFIDYIRYGQRGDSLFILADDTTPISFGNRLLVDNLAVASGPFEERLGFYGSADFGRFGVEAFVDDLYLGNWLNSKAQHAGLRFTFDPASTLGLGLSAVVSANPNGQQAAYPAFDLTWKLKNERRLGIDLLFGMASMLDIDSFSFDTILDVNAGSVSAMFPNFLVAGGLDIRTLLWDFRFIGAVQNRSGTGNLLSLGAFNKTHYSGTPMLDPNAGFHYIVGTEAAYRGKSIGVGGSWYLPIAHDFSEIVALSSDPTVYGDVFAVEATYSGTRFEAALGFRRVGFLSAFSDLLDFSGGFTGFLGNAKNMLINGKDAQPYAAFRYRQGLFGIHGEFSVAQRNATTYVPRVDLGATFTVGKHALDEAIDPARSSTVLGFSEPDGDKLRFTGDLETTYTRSFTSGTDDNHLTVKPVLSVSKGDAFSLGLGAKLSVDLDNSSFYSHDDSPFSFGSGYTGTVGKVYDVATDLFSLIDHVHIGKEGDAFTLRAGKDQRITLGPLVRQLDSSVDSTLQQQVSLTSSVDTEHVDLDLFVNNLADIQLAGMRVGIAPLASYKMEVGISALGSLVLDASKRADLIPGLDLVLPIVSKEKLSFAARGSFATMVGYDSAASFEQMFYQNAGSLLASFDNYILNGGFDLEAGKFSMALDLAMQKGALSYGMFNPLFIRERSSATDSVLASLDSAWSGSTIPKSPRSYTAATKMAWKTDRLDLELSYQLPISAAFSIDSTKDLLTLRGTLDLSWFDLSLSYAKRGFLDAADTLLTDSSASLLSRARNFIVADDSLISAGVSVKQGPLTFGATLSTLAQLAPVAGSWNAQSVTATNPALTLGVGINLF